MKERGRFLLLGVVILVALRPSAAARVELHVDLKERVNSDNERPRVYGERDRDDHDPRDAMMRDLDLRGGEERELVVDRDRVYELNGEDS